MICKSCGRLLPDGQILCPCGGRPVPNISSSMTQTSEVVYADRPANTFEKDYVDFFPPEETVTVSTQGSVKRIFKVISLPKLKYILIAISTVCILVGAISIAIYAFTRPSNVQNFMDSWSNNDYTTAKKIYNDSILGSDTAVVELCTQIKSHLNEEKQAFTEYNLSYTDLSNEITALEMLNIEPLNSFLDTYRNDIIAIRQSHNAFSNAQKYYENGDYPSAVAEYKNVMDTDTANYDTAQAQIKSALVEYKKICYSEAERLMNDGDFEGSIQALSKVLKLDENDEETLQKIQNANETYITKTLNKAAALANDGKYLDAATLLYNTNALIPNSTLTAKADSYMEQYRSAILNSARILADNQDYIGALKLLQENNAQNPCDVFSDTIDQYQSILFKSAKKLYELTPAVQNRIFITDSIKVTDSYGGVYTGCIRFTTKANAEVEYALDKNYIYVNGYITTANQTGFVASMNIKIYVDDKLVFSKDNITRYTNPIPFNIPLVDAQALKIVTSSNSDNSLDYLYIVDSIIY